MTLIFYGSVFVLSLLFSAIYIFMWHKHFDANLNLVFTIVPIACLGYLLLGLSDTTKEVIVAVKITYLGGCFLQLFLLFTILHLCAIDIGRWSRILLFMLSCALYASVLTIGYSDVFYKNLSFQIVGTTRILNKEYGWMHTGFYVVIFLFFAAELMIIGYSWLKRRQVPRTIIHLMIFPGIIVLFFYVGGKRITNQVDLIPLGYVLAQFIYLIIAYRVNLYNVSDTVIDSMVRERAIGYVSFDFKYKYLGSNETAKKIMPELALLAVDETLGYQPAERKLRLFIDTFSDDQKRNLFVYTTKGEDGKEENEKFYNVNVSYLNDGITRRGYIITFTDDTQNRKYINLLDSYNVNLKREVEQKTQHIVEMHDNLIMSLAMMVESRDNSTGGHIKRTSEGVRILIDEIKKEGELALSEEFCKDVIKAAPMHDLGKIAVDDAVLRKPGKFTPEEYEKMKHHAAEGARVIHEILEHTEDESFKTIAENVAHYHHERWDGSGYPKGLSGEEIPIEARIMAIADVYDALVSKRVYKEAFDFARADAIIMEGMGTQFDPGLKTVYENARPRLEKYYSTT
ncbi:MAG: HD domain-containing protein [Lachnospiraceae bacterium]|nr:HD domain-containing protein [Lachnospiraceae bacterium]